MNIDLNEFLACQQEGNFMRNGYNPDHPLIKRTPFITMNVSVVGKHCDTLDEMYDKTASMLYSVDENDPSVLSMESPLDDTKISHPAAFVLQNSGKMFIEPYLETLPDLFVSYFVKLMKVGNNIPRMEYYMTKSK